MNIGILQKTVMLISALTIGMVLHASTLELKCGIGEPEVGLTIRNRNSIKTVPDESCWQSKPYFFDVKDSEFLKQGISVVDVELEVYVTRKDTISIKGIKQGKKELIYNFRSPRKVKEGWRTIRFEAEGLEFPVDKKAPQHFTLYNSKGNLKLRRFKVTGYTSIGNVKWSRMLKCVDISPGKPVFLYSIADDAIPAVTFRNYANKAVSLYWTMRLLDFDEKELQRRTEPVTFKPNAVNTIPVRFSKDLPYGVYHMKLSLAVSPDKPPFEARTVNLGICSPTKIRKAARGEYRYGIDPKLQAVYNDEAILAWLDAMGADVVRGGFVERRSSVEKRLEELRQGMKIYARHGLSPMYQLNPPDSRWKNREQLMKDSLIFLKAAAKEFGNQIPFWELGNEPNLTGFYRDSMEEYTRDYIRFYDAIKAGNPETTVFNGGLCYTLSERSRRFVELVPVDKIDGFTYHAHGFGSAAERRGYTKFQRVIQMYNKTQVPIMADTETGYAAKEKESERDQAHTAAQKMVFAQSKDMLLFWFRVWTWHKYSCTDPDDKRQPRPAILAYRSVVEQLRGFTFDRQIQLHAPELQAYLFKQGKKRVCVLWNENQSEQRTALYLGSNRQSLNNVELYDVFSNRIPCKVRNSGTVEVSLTPSPVYIHWQADTVNPAPVSETALFISLPYITEVITGAENSLDVVITNVLDRRLNGRLDIDPSFSGLSLDSTSIPVNLFPGKSRTIKVRATTSGETSSLWPTNWTVLAHTAPVTSVALSSMTTNLHAKFRDTIQGSGEEIDFATVSGDRKVKDSAVCLGEINSPEDQVISIGIASDWWRLVCLNGNVVEDTRTARHGAGEFHTIDLPLKAGRNILGICVLSGSNGWKLNLTDPEKTARMKGGGSRLKLRLVENNKTIAAIQSKISIISPLSQVDKETLDSGQAWKTARPIGRFGEKQIENHYVIQPDSSRWWKGNKDLCGKVQAVLSAKDLIIKVTVTDDQHDISGKAPDSLSLQLTSRSAEPLNIDLGPQNNMRRKGWDGSITRDAARRRTSYLVRIKNISAIQKPHLQIKVADNDGGILKQHAYWPAKPEDGPSPFPLPIKE